MSHPVKLWKPMRACQKFSDNILDNFEMFKNLLLFPVPVSKRSMLSNWPENPKSK